MHPYLMEKLMQEHNRQIGDIDRNHWQKERLERTPRSRGWRWGWRRSALAKRGDLPRTL
ncbi:MULTISPECIES: hypothetical protein [Saccharibacillus]|uniref:hypothetical protein n=1 Tax=Saccharibacillus TaxID=456492 RepID=UPI00131372ED|nr:hypothetical protein [Saccharibacillus sp. WB 17]MWJ32831.1 hypothetical protein [Saccharibacillus sp. WB 17]